jgi:NADH:ubiquinone oxidoreductase subunit 5 (subunit L)/multisubunit Na+/H+ antiporter MnhA subunit
MLRILLQYLLPLLLPFLAYLVYARLTRRAGLNDAPWLGLAAAGVGLLVVSLVTWSIMSGSEPGETYVPARVEDGQVVPGRAEP